MYHRYIAIAALLVCAPLVSFAQSTDTGKTLPTGRESETAAVPPNPRKGTSPTLKDPEFIAPTKPAEISVSAPGEPTSAESPFATLWASEGLAFAPGFVAPRVTLRHDFGNGPGFQNGFTYLEGFIPWRQTRNDVLVFSNLRTVNFDDADLWEFNVGIGARKYNLSLPSFSSHFGRSFAELASDGWLLVTPRTWQKDSPRLSSSSGDFTPLPG